MLISTQLEKKVGERKFDEIGRNFDASRVVRVAARTRTYDQVKLRLEDGSNVLIRPYAPVGKGDRLLVEGTNLSIFLSSTFAPVPLTPSWTTEKSISAGWGSHKVTIKEIESKEELDGFVRLTERHYRGAGGVGRTVPLIATIECWDLPRVIGFIELASAFLVNTARKRVFDASFSEPSQNIAWARWDSMTAARFTNIVARISRCVVHPEFRGLGLSSLLVDACVAFARQRWHFGNMRPLFLEITADMLRYFPFVQQSGFTYIGDTEGNEHRLTKDMTYLLRRSIGLDKRMGLPKGGGGILALQRSYAMMLGEVVREKRTSVEKLLKVLRMNPEDLSDDEWVLLHKVFRRPKPTYLLGLTTRADQFVKRAEAKGTKKRKSVRTSDRKPKVSSDPVVLAVSDVSLSVVTTPSSSSRSRKVQEAFGIVSKEFKVELIRNLDVRINRGEIILVAGPSGTGKTLLLRALTHLAARQSDKFDCAEGVRVSGVSTISPAKVVWLRSITGDATPIDLLSGETLEDALRLLATAGLAEPQLFIRNASQLSEGQAYRMSLAVALAQRPELLMADAFCEPLDRFSAAAVCKRLRNLSRDTGLAVVVATANPDRLAGALNPDRILVLSSTGDAFWRQPSDIGENWSTHEDKKGTDGCATEDPRARRPGKR